MKDRQELGFTLIELLVSIFIVAIGMLAMVNMLITDIRSNQNSELRMDSAGIAQSVMSKVSMKAKNTAGYTPAQAQADANALLPAGSHYTATVTMSANTAANTAVDIIVQVSWNDRGKTRTTTLRTRVAQ